ncbi:MAG: amidohydrolase family protein [Planctomycetes bacterium]|nr:amidohydrolase family protein [Planctomycetota bacterium]
MKSTIHDTRIGKLLGLATFLGAFAFATPSFAQEEGGEKKDEAAKNEEKPDEDKWFAVINADVFPGTGGHFRDATILAKNGKITEIGVAVDVPDDATVLDAGGLRVYPGLVAYASAGLFGNASSDFADTVNTFSPNLVMALGNGITTAGQSGAALKLKRGEVDGVLLKEKASTLLSYSSQNPQGKRSLIDKFEATAAYLRDYRAWEEEKKTNKDAKEPPKKDSDATILQVLKGEVRARFQADDRDELLGIARLAQKYGFRPVIEGCREGWTVAEELGRAGAYAVITPRDRVDKSEELVAAGGTSIENAAILRRAGVQIAIVPAAKGVDLGGIAGRDILALAIEAGFGVRGGLTNEAALEAITIVPARLLGVEHRVGTLEVGKDCDLLVCDGDLMHYETFVQQAVVEGKVVYEKNKELFYAHIRPNETSALAPPTRVDKGQEGAAKPADEAKDKDEKKPDEKQDGKDGEKKD